MSRYDGLADWYDDEQAKVSARPDSPWPLFAQLVGDAPGVVLDIGCGTGVSSAALAAPGRSVIGVDVSAEQLAIGRTRIASVVLADAERLPFRTGALGAVAMAFVHTDVDDFAAVVADAARVLRSDGRITYLGIHPCFVGHHIDSPQRDTDRRVVFAGYDNRDHVDESPQFGTGIRSRVGMRHVPLADLLHAFLDAPLQLERVVEHGDGLVPWVFALRARRVPS